MKDDEKKMLSWLEKQGEQKPADKVEPKFKAGDWIVNKDGSPFSCGETAVQITQVDGKEIWLESKTWTTTKRIRMWTIQDAKDGDVLINDFHLIFFFKEIKNNTYISHCSIIDRGNDVIIISMAEREVGDVNIVKCQPATKKQCDLLFQKMKEAGYEWDAEKKELRIIEQKPYPETLDKAIELYYYSYGNGKGGFDKLSLDNFRDIVKTFVDDYGNKPNHWKPSEEQLNAFEHFVRSIGESGYASPYDDNTKLLYSLLNDLKNL